MIYENSHFLSKTSQILCRLRKTSALLLLSGIVSSGGMVHTAWASVDSETEAGLIQDDQFLPTTEIDSLVQDKQPPQSARKKKGAPLPVQQKVKKYSTPREQQVQTKKTRTTQPLKKSRAPKKARVVKKSQLHRYQHKARTRRALNPYLKDLKWGSKEIKWTTGSSISLQVGKHKRIIMGVSAYRHRCFHTIMKSGTILQSYFPEFTFLISGKIQKCTELNKGVQTLVKNKKNVRSNIAQFATPLHSVFLTDRTKFNHFSITELGLHVNVNRPGEINRRLVLNQTSARHIRHEEYTKR